MDWVGSHHPVLCLAVSSVPSDFTAVEKIEMESMRIYKKDLLEDIQVNTHTHTHTHTHTNSLTYSLKIINTNNHSHTDTI